MKYRFRSISRTEIQGIKVQSRIIMMIQEQSQAISAKNRGSLDRELRKISDTMMMTNSISTAIEIAVLGITTIKIGVLEAITSCKMMTKMIDLRVSTLIVKNLVSEMRQALHTPMIQETPLFHKVKLCNVQKCLNLR